MLIRDVTLAARRLAPLRAFYVGALGFLAVEDTPARLSLRVGASTLTFEEAGRGEDGAYHVAFAAPARRWAEAKTWAAPLLGRDGADEFASGLWAAPQAYFADPDGNVLEIVARPIEASAESGAFGPFRAAELAGLVEVGVPVDDVQARARELAAAFGLAVPASDSSAFLPVGDDAGRLILVPAGRPWFPTATPAAALPLRATLRSERSGSLSFAGFPYAFTSS